MPTAVCPQCGGGSARALAPGYVECESSVLYNVIPAGAQGNPAPVPLYRRCGYRYQVAASPGAVPGGCSCGMYSVAACAECGRLLCGDHLQHHSGEVLCGEHLSARRRADEAAGAAKQAAARAHAVAAREAWERRAAAALSAVADPVEQHVRLVVAGITAPVTAELQGLIPTRPSDAEIAGWFVGAAGKPSQTIAVSVRGRFGTRRRNVRGWIFPEGSAHTVYRYGDMIHLTISVLVDGRVWYTNMLTPRAGEYMNPAMIKKMAELVALRPLMARQPGDPANL